MGILSVRCGLAAANVDVTMITLNPSAIGPVAEIEIERTVKIDNLTIGAAQITPTFRGVQKWVGC